MFYTDDFNLLKDRILQFGERNYQLGKSEVLYPELPFKDVSKDVCVPLRNDLYIDIKWILSTINKIEKEYTDMLYDLSD